MRIRLTLKLAVPLLLSSFISAQTANSGAVISLERTECLGSCPVYKVTIHGDGTVTYEGRKYVRVAGKHTKHISPTEVAKLVDEMVAAGFFELEDNYTSIKYPDGSESVATDLPTTYAFLQLGKQEKSVQDYYGAPGKLKALEQRIDDVAGTKPWTFLDGATVRDLAKHGWNAKSKEVENYLLQAAEYGDEEVVDALLEIGVNPETPKLAVPPLQVATSGPVTRRLIKAGANVNSKVRSDLGRTAMENMAQFGEPDGLRALIEAGGDVNYRDKFGWTILMYAASGKDSRNVQLLINAGAKVSARSKDGKTALSVAETCVKQQSEERHPDPFDHTPHDCTRIVQLLHEAGAK